MCRSRVVALAIVVLIVVLQSNGQSSTEESTTDFDQRLHNNKLRDYLLKNYDPSRVPLGSTGGGINVTVYMWPYDILEVVLIVPHCALCISIFHLFSNEASGAIRISGWFDMVSLSC